MPSNQIDLAAAITAALLGLLGRLMSMAQERRNPFSGALAWELPAAIGLGWLGRAIGEYVGLQGFELMSASIVVAYMGPRMISWGMARMLKAPELEK